MSLARETALAGAQGQRQKKSFAVAIFQKETCDKWLSGDHYASASWSCIRLFIVEGERLTSGMIDKLMYGISNMIPYIYMRDNLLVQIHYLSVCVSQWWLFTWINKL